MTEVSGQNSVFAVRRECLKTNAIYYSSPSTCLFSWRTITSIFRGLSNHRHCEKEHAVAQKQYHPLPHPEVYEMRHEKEQRVEPYQHGGYGGFSAGQRDVAHDRHNPHYES